jgi:hypothetical protein
VADNKTQAGGADRLRINDAVLLHWMVTLQRSETSAPECYYILSTSEKSAIARAKRIVGNPAELLDIRPA